MKRFLVALKIVSYGKILPQKKHSQLHRTRENAYKAVFQLARKLKVEPWKIGIFDNKSKIPID